jgi:hypothetical protein
MGDFYVRDITCNTGYGPDADGISATICAGAGQPYNVTGCSDTNGCAGVDCGTGAECTDNPAPGTGHICSCITGYTGENTTNRPANCVEDIQTTGQYYLGELGLNCTEVCAAHDNKNCIQEQDDSLYSQDIFNEIQGQFNCGNNFFDYTQYPQSSVSPLPAIVRISGDNPSRCGYNTNTNFKSTCDARNGAMIRICKCSE